MKRSRYRSRSGQRKMPLWGIFAICFLGALLIALVVGLILNATLDEETYYRLTTKPKNKQDDTILFVPDLPNVVAFPFAFGDELSALDTKSAVSLALNNPDRSYRYHSDALDYFGKGKSDGATLSTTLAALSNADLYVSGIFYPAAPTERVAEIRYAMEAEETAVAKEFFSLGGNDLVLCGLDLSSGMTATLSYLKSLKLAVGQKPIGVAIPYELLLDENAGNLLERLLTVCDFVALDLRNTTSDKPLDEVLAQTKYSYAQYRMRLLLSQKQTAWISDAGALGLSNYEILK